MEAPSWDELFMTMVYLVASKSKDQSTHLGAVAVGPDNEVVTVGYNSFVRGINDDAPARQARPEKYFWFEHAERNAIYNATLIGASLKGCKIYTNGVPCMDCARGIIQAGIKEIIVDEEWERVDTEGWEEHCRRSLIMFEEAGIKIRFWQGKLLAVCKFKRGKTI